MSSPTKETKNSVHGSARSSANDNDNTNTHFTPNQSFEIDVDALMEAREANSSRARLERTSLKTEDGQRISASQSQQQEPDEATKRTILALAEEEEEEKNKAKTPRTTASSTTAAENYRAARRQRKIKQDKKAAASITTSSSSSRDQVAALALARQDLQEKSNQNSPLATVETEQTVEEQRRLAGEPSTPASTTTPTPPKPPVPVGAFRINPSESGRFAIQSAAEADVSVAPTIVTNNTPPTAVIESNIVLESTLVEEESERREERRRNYRDPETTTTNTNTIDEEMALPLETAPPPPPPPPSDDDLGLVITAETPTLNDSVWTLLKSRKGFWGIVVLIAVVATLTVLGVTVWEKQNIVEILPQGPPKSNPTKAPTATPTISPAPSVAPSPAPTTATPTASPTIRQLTLQDLPNSTIALIQTQPNSPQAKAWRWLQYDDTLGTSKIPQYDQTLQRFVLVTLYYATNGPGWQFQRYWLDHETPECDWWPHVTGVNWPFDQGPTVCTEQGGYSKLLLANNALEGTLPSELSLLPYLTTVDVSGNPDLTGDIPLCGDTEKINAMEVLISCDNPDLTCECGCECV